MLTNFEYLCLNKFCSCGHVVPSKGSKEWNHNLASPSNVRQNLWIFTSSLKRWAFIQSLECSRWGSASSSGFSENSGLKLDQFICKCHCPAASWFCCWFCPCLWLGAAAHSSLSAIFLTFINFLPLYVACLLHDFSCFQLLLSVIDVINLLWYIYYSQISACPRCLNLMIYFSWKLTATKIFPILSGIVPDIKPFCNFPYCFCIIPDDLKSLASFLSLWYHPRQ